VRIVVGASLEGGCWPGPLRHRDRDGASRTAILDEAWVGIEGLVDLLSVRTGTARLDPPGGGERAADLARRLRSAHDDSAPWATSLAAEPLATAHALLQVRDALLAAGVDDDTAPERLPPRLARVLAATRDALPGTLERARDIARALRDGWSARVERIDVIDDVDLLPVPLRVLLDALAADGTVVSRFVPRTAADLDDVGDNDLARARALLSGASPRDDLSLQGDGSLVMLRHDSVDETAAEVASFLAGAAGGLVVAPAGDGGLLLDEALARHHAPTLGVRGSAGTDALLALLPLVVAVGDVTVDPQRLYELCVLPLSPLPRSVGARVAHALLHTPSLHAEAVHRAVDAGLAVVRERAVADVGVEGAAARVDALRARILALVPGLASPVFGSMASPASGALSSATLHECMGALLRFLQGRKNREHGPFDEHTPYRAAIRQVTTALRLLALLDAPTVSPSQLLRLLHAATDGARPPAPQPARAGFVVVDDPGAVLGPVETVVWWGFSQASGALRPTRVLGREEVAALRAEGFSPPIPDHVARAHARRERRPFDAAVERLVLCCPRRGESGVEHHPHPLWDELFARLPARARVAAHRAVVRPEDGQPDLVGRVLVSARSPAAPRRIHRVPRGAFAVPDVVSPSGDELLLGCPLRYVLTERGVAMRSRSWKDGARLEGEVIHAVVARVLRGFPGGRPPSPTSAADAARACFGGVVAAMAGAWLRPHRQQVWLRVRERAARTVHDLVEWLVDNEMVVRAIEDTVEKNLPPLVLDAPEATIAQTLRGTPDLVVEGPHGTFIVDHKSGGDTDKRGLLAAGAALQLVEYAALVGQRGRPWPAFGYYQLRARRLMTTDARVRGADVVPGPVAKDAWRPLERARARAWRALRDGVVVATGVADSADGVVGRPEVVDGVLQIVPPCRSCPADVLCGRALVASNEG
jgi:hypothetical protein